jgi:threonine dehydrogenase-like Zn-dependent dehydrogenase
MKAARIHGPRTITYDTVDDPKIQDNGDVILKVTATAICGSDLHIYSGGLPQIRPMVMGHEFMGIVEETGALLRVVRVSFAIMICRGIVKTAIRNTMVQKVDC